MWALTAFKHFRHWTDASPTTRRLQELHNPSNLRIQNLCLLKLKNAQLANFLPRPRSSKKRVGCVPSKTWQMSAIISLMSSSPNSLRCNDDDDLQSRVPTIAINPVTQLLTLAPSRWHGLTLNSRNCSFSVRPTWDWCHQGASEEVMSESVRGRPGQREMAALIWTLRNVMCVRSCETRPALRITFRKALATWPGSTGVMCQGKRLVSVDSSVSNLYTTLARQTPWEAFFSPLVACFKGRGSTQEKPRWRSCPEHRQPLLAVTILRSCFLGGENFVKTSPRKLCGAQIKPTSPYLSQVENLCGLSF